MAVSGKAVGTAGGQLRAPGHLPQVVLERAASVLGGGIEKPQTPA